MPLLNFTDKPDPLIRAEINTAITLFWQIRYESCSQGSEGCFREELDVILLNDSNLLSVTERMPAGDQEFLFDAAATRISGGPNDTFSYANVQVIMFINEYIDNNVESLICTAKLLRTNSPRRIDITSTVDIEVINQTEKAISSQCTSKPTSEPPTCTWACNSALVVYSPALSLKLLCFCQFLLLYTIASCCT